MEKRIIPFLCWVGLLSLPLTGQAEQTETPSVLRDVGIDQRLNEEVPLHLTFRDETGQRVRLGGYFKDKPVILVLAYYQCPMLCTQVLEGLAGSLKAVSFDVGTQFDVVTVSFNPRETPRQAAAEKETVLRRYGRAHTAPGWHFLTGEQSAITALTRAVGFRYTYDDKTGQYAHASGIVVLTPGGKISRYFYGIEYPPKDVRLGLVEASQNKIGSLVDQVLLLCYRYDPATGKYSAVVLNSVRLGGVVTILGLGAFFLAMWRRERRKN